MVTYRKNILLPSLGLTIEGRGTSLVYAGCWKVETQTQEWRTKYSPAWAEENNSTYPSVKENNTPQLG
jgi:hypothetical protein